MIWILIASINGILIQIQPSILDDYKQELIDYITNMQSSVNDVEVNKFVSLSQVKYKFKNLQAGNIKYYFSNGCYLVIQRFLIQLQSFVKIKHIANQKVILEIKVDELKLKALIADPSNPSVTLMMSSISINSANIQAGKFDNYLNPAQKFLIKYLQDQIVKKVSNIDINSKVMRHLNQIKQQAVSYYGLPFRLVSAEFRQQLLIARIGSQLDSGEGTQNHFSAAHLSLIVPLNTIGQWLNKRLFQKEKMNTFLKEIITVYGKNDVAMVYSSGSAEVKRWQGEKVQVEMRINMQTYWKGNISPVRMQVWTQFRAEAQGNKVVLKCSKTEIKEIDYSKNQFIENRIKKGKEEINSLFNTGCLQQTLKLRISLIEPYFNIHTTSSQIEFQINL